MIDIQGQAAAAVDDLVVATNKVLVNAVSATTVR